MACPPPHPCLRLPCRSAFVKNFEVCFLSDGTATANQRMHAASLLNLGYGFASVLTCADMAAELLAQGQQASPRRGQEAAGHARHADSASASA
jgi:isochorismate hydrolase